MRLSNYEIIKFVSSFMENYIPIHCILSSAMYTSYSSMIYEHIVRWLFDKHTNNKFYTFKEEIVVKILRTLLQHLIFLCQFAQLHTNFYVPLRICV